MFVIAEHPDPLKSAEGHLTSAAPSCCWLLQPARGTTEQPPKTHLFVLATCHVCKYMRCAHGQAGRRAGILGPGPLTWLLTWLLRCLCLWALVNTYTVQWPRVGPCTHSHPVPQCREEVVGWCLEPPVLPWVVAFCIMMFNICLSIAPKAEPDQLTRLCLSGCGHVSALDSAGENPPCSSLQITFALFANWTQFVNTGEISCLTHLLGAASSSCWPPPPLPPGGLVLPCKSGAGASCGPALASLSRDPYPLPPLLLFLLLHTQHMLSLRNGVSALVI